jgi:hypothetical protein
MQEAGVKQQDSESSPSVGLRAGAFAEVGTLILTNRRLIYASKGGAFTTAARALGGALAARAIEKNVAHSGQSAPKRIILRLRNSNLLIMCPANYVPPPPSAVPTCPFCGGQLTFIQQYKMWYCYRDQRYV